MRRTRKSQPYTESSGNVFRDIGLPNPEEELTKSSLLRELCLTIEAKGLKQVEAAKILGIPQPKVSALLRGHFTGFSVQRLSVLLRRLGKTVTIVISDEAPASRPGEIPVVRDSAGLLARMTCEPIVAAGLGPGPYRAGGRRPARASAKARKTRTRRGM